MDILQSIDNMVNELETAKSNAVKFIESNNSSAGAKVRGSMQSVKKIAQEVRVEVQKKREELKKK